jgi:ABC-type glycerol-3-phosphate transport system substrate-binding protein
MISGKGMGMLRFSPRAMAVATAVAISTAACAGPSASVSPSPSRTAGSTTAAPSSAAATTTTSGAVTASAAPTTATSEPTTAAPSASASSGGDLTGNLDVRVYGDWPFVERNAKDYMALHPGVTIKVGGITNDELSHQTVRTFVSSEAPDIASTTLNKDLLSQWLQAGAVVKLNDVWDQAGLEAVHDPAVVAQATEPDGSRYVVPLGLTITPILFYNKTAFEKAKVTPPTNPERAFGSLDDFSKAIDAVKAAGFDPPLSLFGDNVLYQIPLGQVLAAKCGGAQYMALAQNFLKDAPADAPRYDSGCALDAFKWFRQWIDSGWISKSYPAVTYDQTVALFETKAAIWESGSWAPPVYTPPFAWDWMAMPSGVSGKPQMGVGLDSFVVPSGSKNQALAKAFIAFMVSKEELEKQMGRVPARTDVDLAKVIGPNDTEISIAKATSNFELVPLWGGVVPTDVVDAGYQAWQGLVDGSLTPEQAAKAFQDSVETYKSSH